MSGFGFLDLHGSDLPPRPSHRLPRRPALHGGGRSAGHRACPPAAERPRGQQRGLRGHGHHRAAPGHPRVRAERQGGGRLLPERPADPARQGRARTALLPRPVPRSLRPGGPPRRRTRDPHRGAGGTDARPAPAHHRDACRGPGPAGGGPRAHEAPHAEGEARRATAHRHPAGMAAGDRLRGRRLRVRARPVQPARRHRGRVQLRQRPPLPHRALRRHRRERAALRPPGPAERGAAPRGHHRARPAGRGRRLPTTLLRPTAGQRGGVGEQHRGHRRCRHQGPGTPAGLLRPPARPGGPRQTGTPDRHTRPAAR